MPRAVRRDPAHRTAGTRAPVVRHRRHHRGGRLRGRTGPPDVRSRHQVRGELRVRGHEQPLLALAGSSGAAGGIRGAELRRSLSSRHAGRFADRATRKRAARVLSGPRRRAVWHRGDARVRPARTRRRHPEGFA